MKILSPAGNFESLKLAVFNGADEVYLGINDFNARNNIDGFTLDNLKEAIDFAHFFDVKVNLAINILFSDIELQTALNTIVEAYNMGVDYFIVQDLGLASLVHKHYPQITLHASTQMAIHNLEGVKFIEQFGFKRVVLARETPLEEIKRIKENSSIEIEYFVQGALCVSFSGNCYLSSYLCNASGNRGKCKQLCRLPYKLIYKNKELKNGYLLSAKDFNMINKLDNLKNAGVDILKIEGRARRPYYVATATREYYNALKGNKVNYENLELAFNRKYTPGYFDDNNNIISTHNNHIGIKIGNILKVVYGKNFNEVYFSSNRTLSPKSTFKIFNNGIEKNTLTAYDLTKISYNEYKLTTTQKPKTGDDIHLIIDYADEKTILSLQKKKPINIKIYSENYKPIKAVLTINKQNVEIFGEKLEPATNQPITEEIIKQNFKKSDIFDANVEIKTLDNVFIQNKNLNEFRRKVFNVAFNEITKNRNIKLKKIKVKSNFKINKFENFQFITELKERFTATNIIYSPERYDLKSILEFVSKCNSLNKTPYLETPNFALKKDIALLKEIVNKSQVSIVANNYYALELSQNHIIGAGLNVYNSITASCFDKPIITAESDISTKIDFPYMTLRHCPMKEHIGGNCSKCLYKDGYLYKMDNGTTLKLKRKKLSTCTFYLTK